MTESEGCALLKRCFEQRGYTIRESHRLDDIGVTLDGYDPDKRVGYEYITSAAGDRAEVTSAVIGALEERARNGEMYVLLIDELDGLVAEELEAAAAAFLDEVQKR